MRAIASVLVVAACQTAADGIAIDAAEPAYGPLVGGTRITLHGRGFVAPARVLVGGREAPLAAPTDDATLEVVIPPGEHPGAAELVVLAGDRTANAAGLFHYSAPPTIDSVTPDHVLFSVSGTTITVTGSGFADEGAGPLALALDDVLATDVVVHSDTTLTFTAPAGRPLARPAIEIVDVRGRARKPNAFRYVPSLRGGLLAFAKFGSFGYFVDPVDHDVVEIPGGPPVRFISVVRDPTGEYWAVDRAIQFGLVDTTTQTLISPVPWRWMPAMTPAGDSYYGIDRNTFQLGRVDLATNGFTPLVSVPCCGSYGVAFDGSLLYLVAREADIVGVRTVDPVTGETGTPVPLAPPVHVEELRFYAGTLYGVTSTSTLVTIDPATGAVATVVTLPARAGSLEVFE